jgi:hypothetical protein
MTQNRDLIFKLRDIHLPEPASFFPLPLAWWGVIVFVVTLMCALVYVLRHRRKRPLRSALHKLSLIEQAYQQGGDAGVCLMELGLLLKHYAIIQFPQTQLRHLCGEQWLVFLQKTSRTRLFFGENELDMIYFPYQHTVTPSVMVKLLAAVHQWLMDNPRRSYRSIRL